MKIKWNKHSFETFTTTWNPNPEFWKNISHPFYWIFNPCLFMISTLKFDKSFRIFQILFERLVEYWMVTRPLKYGSLIWFESHFWERRKYHSTYFKCHSSFVNENIQFFRKYLNFFLQFWMETMFHFAVWKWSRTLKFEILTKVELKDEFFKKLLKV